MALDLWCRYFYSFFKIRLSLLTSFDAFLGKHSSSGFSSQRINKWIPIKWQKKWDQQPGWLLSIKQELECLFLGTTKLFSAKNKDQIHWKRRNPFYLITDHSFRQEEKGSTLTDISLNSLRRWKKTIRNMQLEMSLFMRCN